MQSTNPVGRWLIYTEGTGPTLANTLNGLSGKSFYGSAYDYFNEQFAVAPNAGNRFVYSYQPTITVAPDSRIVTYNGVVPTTSATVTGLVNGDLFTDAWTGALVINGATSKAAGTYVLTADVSGLDLGPQLRLRRRSVRFVAHRSQGPDRRPDRQRQDL